MLRLQLAALMCATMMVFVVDARGQSPTTSDTAVQSSDSDDWNVVPPGVHYSFNLLGSYTFAADVHGASGSVSKTIFGGEIDMLVPVNDRLSLGFDALGGGAAYHFRGPAGLFAGDAPPWGTILTESLGASATYHFDDRWTAYAGINGYSAGEDGAIYGDTLSVGGTAAVEYTVSKQLTVGVAVAVLSRLEADPYVIPVPLIDWVLPFDPQGRWRLKVGETQVGASESAGVTLAYSPSKHWSFTAAVGGVGLGNEFRLDHDGPVPGGVGRSSAYPVILGVTWRPIRPLQVNAFAGATTFGTIDDIDHTGSRVGRQNLDAAPLVGVSASFSF